MNTSATSLTAFDEFSLGALTNATMTAGQILTFEETKAGNGVDFDGTAIVVEYVLT
jgi:hypothetical protein